MAWQKGPLPKDTYGFGGVVKAGDDPKAGFYFADFMGDHVLTHTHKRLEPHEVAQFDNSLTLPPSE